MKKFAALTLSLALGASLAAPAMAVEADIVPISAPDTGYATSITLNGETLDITGIPAAKEGYLPMRLVAEGDHGSAQWYQEESYSAFYLDGAYVTVRFNDWSIQVGEETVADVTAQLIDGVTFIPTSVLANVEGYTVATGEDGSVTITTPNNDPLIQLGYDIIDSTELGCRMKTDAKAWLENYSLDYGKSFESATLFVGMNITPDTLFMGKLAQGADEAAVKAALEAYRKSQEDTFSWYLSQNLPKVQDARTIVEGGYVLFLIGDNADQGVELFRTFVAGQSK